MTIVTQNQIGLSPSYNNICVPAANGSFSMSSSYAEVRSIPSTSFVLGSVGADFTMPSDGRLTYTGTKTKPFRVGYNVGFAPASNPFPVALNFELRKNGSASSISNPVTKCAPNSNGFTFHASLTSLFVPMSTNDYISLWAQWSSSSSVALNFYTILIFAESVGI